MEIINDIEHYTAKEITELCSVTASAFNNAVYRHGLTRIMHGKRWYYPQSSLDAYRRICTKNTAPLQSQSEPAELPPAAMQSLDPFDDPFDQAALPYSTTSFVEEDPEPVEESDGSEAQPSTPEVSPEIAMLSLVISRIRRKVAREEAEKFIEVLRRMRNVIVTTHAMQLMAIDNAIAECEVDDDDTSSQ